MPPAVDHTLSEDDLNPDIEAAQDAGAVSPTDLSDRSDQDAPEGSVMVDRKYYNPQDGLRGRPGGVYLDVQERAQAEERRALSEGREPDYDNLPSAAGTTLVTKERLVDNSFSNPASAEVAPVKQVDPVATLATDVGVGTVDEDTTYADQVQAENQARQGNVSEGDTPTDTGDEVTGADASNAPGNDYTL